MRWLVGVLVEARAGARVGAVSLLLASETIYRVSFLNRNPSLRVSLGSMTSGRGALRPR